MFFCNFCICLHLLKILILCCIYFYRNWTAVLFHYFVEHQFIMACDHHASPTWRMCDMVAVCGRCLWQSGRVACDASQIGCRFILVACIHMHFEFCILNMCNMLHIHAQHIDNSAVHRWLCACLSVWCSYDALWTYDRIRSWITLGLWRKHQPAMIHRSVPQRLPQVWCSTLPYVII